MIEHYRVKYKPTIVVSVGKRMAGMGDWGETRPGDKAAVVTGGRAVEVDAVTGISLVSGTEIVMIIANIIIYQ